MTTNTTRMKHLHQHQHPRHHQRRRLLLILFMAATSLTSAIFTSILPAILFVCDSAVEGFVFQYSPLQPTKLPSLQSKHASLPYYAQLSSTHHHNERTRRKTIASLAATSSNDGDNNNNDTVGINRESYLDLAREAYAKYYSAQSSTQQSSARSPSIQSS